ncbi:MAG: transcriptional regulator, partial [Acidobacteriaceae bacterium]|nr:transcriptional regulator [Acidobacteriaceae bacterium]
MALKTLAIYEFGPFRLEPAERRLLREGESIPLTPKGFELLSYLVANHGRLLLKEQIMQAVWPDSFVEEANLSYNISLLRKALGESPSTEQHYIQTVPRRGYRFVANVRLQEAKVAGTEERPVAVLTGGESDEIPSEEGEP